MSTFRISRAKERDSGIVIGLIDGRVPWLREKGTDQWQKPWPSLPDRDNRVMFDIKSGKTWILWDRGTAAATITTAEDDTLNPYLPELWLWEDRASAALYVRRLVVACSHAGKGVGAALLNWAGKEASRDYGAKWTRIDVWKTNEALHRYYLQLGFEFVGFHGDDEYPSTALFQRAINKDADTGAIEPLTVLGAHGVRVAAR